MTARYSAQQVAAMTKHGHAFRLADGTLGFACADREDVERGLRAVEAHPGPSERAAIRRYLARRAREIGCPELVPEGRAPDSRGKASDGPTGPQDGPRLHPVYVPRVTVIRDLADAMLHGGGDPAPPADLADGDVTGDDSDDGSSSGGNPQVRSIDVRAATDDDGQMVLVGAPIQYNVSYQVFDASGAFDEIMAPGVCRDTLTQPTVFLYGHSGMVLARCPASLTLTDTPTALLCRAVLNDTSASRDLYAAVQRRDITQMSIGFVTAEDSWNSDYTQRVVIRIARLVDASAVGNPASPTTWIKVAGSPGPTADAARQARSRAEARARLQELKRKAS
jgi:HK97 family phage prohead protease